MIPLILFIALAVLIVVLFEIRERQKSNNSKNGLTTERSNNDGCCGQHLVCERETLLQTNAKIEYYDDEELDEMAGINPDEYTPSQHEMIRQVFATLQESDVPGWCRSLQLRHIELPPDIREEALLIVRERRSKNNGIVAQ